MTHTYSNFEVSKKTFLTLIKNRIVYARCGFQYFKISRTEARKVNDFYRLKVAVCNEENHIYIEEMIVN